MEDRLLTVRETAERLRVSEWTIRRWLRASELKGFRLGAKAGWRLRESELEVFLRRKEGER